MLSMPAQLQYVTYLNIGNFRNRMLILNKILSIRLQKIFSIEQCLTTLKIYSVDKEEF